MSEKLQKLRALLKDELMDGFVLPCRDEYGKEVVAPWNRRLEWLTGFTGDAGYALIFADEAFLLVDGRFTLQAQKETDPQDFKIMSLADGNFATLVSAKMKVARRIGYDPKLHTITGIIGMRKVCAKVKAFLLAVKKNPIDVLWEDKPVPVLSKVFLPDEKFFGCSVQDKIVKVADAIKKRDEDAVILSSPESICWLLNARTHDKFLPVANAFAIVYASGSVDWFIDQEAVDEAVRKGLGDRVRILPPAIFKAEIERVVKKRNTISLDPNQSSGWLENIIAVCGGNISMGEDPCAILKAIKNDVEIAGMRKAHIKDGVALCRFFAWLEAKGIGRTEYEAAQKLEEIKADLELYQGPSFATIAATGANGAIVHYTPPENGSQKIQKNDVFLLDSGSQFLDGTTDVTRTVCFAPQAMEVKERFTEVLKGHIALAAALFPKGIYGFQLDALARQFLWRSGHNYAHGTGHGVGFFLGVHETPPSISLYRDSVPLAEGMMVTNEPGYYKDGEFGIRLENLMMVKAAGSKGAEEMLCFEPLTLAPFDKSLILKEELTAGEIKWLNAYHQRVFDTLAPLLDTETKEWLKEKTAPF